MSFKSYQEKLMQHSNISMEEADILAGEAIEASNQAEVMLDDAEKSLQIAESTQDLALVVTEIEEVTPTEAQLIELAGDIAVAGTTTDPEEFVPSMEEFIGKKVSLEAVQSGIEKIFIAVGDAIKKIWKMIKDFYNKFFGEVSKLQRLSTTVGALVAKAKKFDLSKASSVTLTQEDISFVGKLSLGNKYISDINGLKKAIADLTELSNKFGEHWLSELATIIRGYRIFCIELGQKVVSAASGTSQLFKFGGKTEFDKNVENASKYLVVLQTQVEKLFSSVSSVVSKETNPKPFLSNFILTESLQSPKDGSNKTIQEIRNSYISVVDLEMPETDFTFKTTTNVSDLEAIVKEVDKMANMLNKNIHSTYVDGIEKMIDEVNGMGKKLISTHRKNVIKEQDFLGAHAIPFDVIKSIFTLSVFFSKLVKSPIAEISIKSASAAKAALCLVSKNVVILEKQSEGKEIILSGSKEVAIA